MRGGRAHELVPESEDASHNTDIRYRCIRCGEGNQVRTSAPSCRVVFLERMEQLQAPYGHMQPAPRRAVLDALVRRRFKWPRPVRELVLDHFERRQVWKTQPNPARPQ